MSIKINTLILLLASSAFLAAQTPTKAAPTHSMTPEAVHRSAIVIDSHADTTTRFVDENFDLTGPIDGGDMNLDAIHKGNLGAEFFSIWVDPDRYRGQYAHRTLEMIDSVRQLALKHPDQIEFVTTPEGIEQAHRNHKFAALMGIEGGHSIEHSLPLLRTYYDLGVRYMTLTWTNSNGWADSSGDYDNKSVSHTQEGLSEFGKDVVYEMNRLGMMVDISHVSDKTFFRTLVISRAPIIASHSSARALCGSPRNMTDDMIRAIANSGGPNSKGGVVQVNFYAGFLSENYRKAKSAIQPKVNKAIAEAKAKAAEESREYTNAEEVAIQRRIYGQIQRPPLSVLIDHIDHIAKVAGVDHVGIGSDFDGIDGQLPAGLDSPADLPKITAALMARGYSAEDCRKILGGNLLRVFKEVQQVSKELQSTERPRISQKQ